MTEMCSLWDIQLAVELVSLLIVLFMIDNVEFDINWNHLILRSTPIWLSAYNKWKQKSFD